MTAAPVAPRGIDRPPSRDLVLMAVGVLGVSTSGPLVVATAVPALAIALWRNVLATAVLAPVALTQHRRELAALRGRTGWWALGAGALLALHFATWVPSLRFTSVASSTALVSMQVVWTALLARATGHVVSARAWVGTGVALAGAVLVTGVDLVVSPRALLGDLLALLGGVFAAGYVVAGAEVRRHVSTTTYTTVCYGTCAMLLLVACVAGGVPLGGYGAADWARLVALTVLAQLLGHSVFNAVLRTTSPLVVALAILLEVPGATLLAALALGQVPPLLVLPAVGLILAGLALVITGQEPQEPREPQESREPPLPVEPPG